MDEQDEYNQTYEVQYSNLSSHILLYNPEINLKAFRESIKKTEEKVYHETKLPRLVWLSIAFTIFIVGIVIVLVGLQRGNISISSWGLVANTIITVPIWQLTKIRRDIASVLTLSLSFEARLNKCLANVSNDSEVRQCLMNAFDHVEVQLLEWREGKPHTDERDGKSSKDDSQSK